MTRKPWKRRAAALIAVIAVGLIGATSAPATAASDGSVTFVGHGYGHGRGMGQYGAYGYAVDQGWSYDAILRHFYGGTSFAGDAGNPTISVELSTLTGRDTIVTGPGLTVNGGVVGNAALLVQSDGGGNFVTYSAAGCGGPWTRFGPVLGSGLSVSTSDGVAVTCGPTKSTGYRGSIQAVNRGGVQYALNVVPVENYLWGVVPREMPASWASAGGGRGAQALQAQAVAARGYVLGSAPRPTSGATTCDNESCQVYGGLWEQPYGGAYKALEDARSTAAVQATSGQVMRAGNGAIARTEFSSSTGGWTAGGAFAAVEDAGDATASNANHTWTVSLSLADVAAALGVGEIRSIVVTQRNGLGAEGGRALGVTVAEASGRSSVFSGDTMRIKLGLKSNWFTTTTSSSAEAQAVVTALYQDVLGRATDPQGLANWTSIVLTTGAPRLVADGIVNSKERLQALAATEYTGAVHRGPDAMGLANWVQLMEAGMTVSELQIGIYASPESLAVLGGGDTTVWVGAMYKALLGRDAAPSESAAWAQVAATSGREAAVAGIARSAEAGTQRLTGYYMRFLGRGLDASGLASWLPSMPGRGDFTIPGMIGGSAEYWNRAQLRYP